VLFTCTACQPPQWCFQTIHTQQALEAAAAAAAAGWLLRCGAAADTAALCCSGSYYCCCFLQVQLASHPNGTVKYFILSRPWQLLLLPVATGCEAGGNGL
jgi:hypothetical protein